MNYCDKFKESFSSYIEDELAPDTRKVLESHLSICPECKETVYRLRYLRKTLGGLSAVSTSPEFEYRLNQRLRHLENRRGGMFPLNYIQDWKVPAFGLALVLVVFSFFMFFDSDPAKLDINSPPQQSSFPANIPVEDKTVISEENPEEPAPPVANTPQDTTEQAPNKDLKKKIKLVKDKPSGK